VITYRKISFLGLRKGKKKKGGEKRKKKRMFMVS